MWHGILVYWYAVVGEIRCRLAHTLSYLILSYLILSCIVVSYRLCLSSAVAFRGMAWHGLMGDSMDGAAAPFVSGCTTTRLRLCRRSLCRRRRCSPSGVGMTAASWSSAGPCRYSGVGQIRYLRLAHLDSLAVVICFWSHTGISIPRSRSRSHHHRKLFLWLHSYIHT